MLDRIRLMASDSIIDLSMINITGGTLSARETANCYVVQKTGRYCFPLVYGCAITGGTANSKSYTKSSTSSYMNDFYNHLNTKITSPYIENVSSPSSAEVIQYDTAGYQISDISIEDGDICKFIVFKVKTIPSLGGNAIIAVKDGNGDIMWSWQIWAYPFTLSTLPHTIPDGTRTYNVLNVNLGWVRDGVNSIYGTSPYYQWGRKDPFLRYGATSGTFTSGVCASNVAQTIKEPTVFNGYLYNNTQKGDWWRGSTDTYFYNYWDANGLATASAVTTEKTIYDPCPVGLVVPCPMSILGYANNIGTNTGTWNGSGWTWDNNFYQCITLRIGDYGKCNWNPTSGAYWLSTAYNASGSFAIALGSSSCSRTSYQRAYGCSIRPILRN